MAKPHSSFVCQTCGAVSQRWQGRCDACGGWNTIAEESAPSGIGAMAIQGEGRGRVFGLSSLLEKDHTAAPRISTGIAELDRVTGGGFVPGSVILLGGEPGIGKSTLVIQACAALA
ncbi:MAG: ATPase domain-containing protein, partial [Methylocella sp.]